MPSFFSKHSKHSIVTEENSHLVTLLYSTRGVGKHFHYLAPLLQPTSSTKPRVSSPRQARFLLGPGVEICSTLISQDCPQPSQTLTVCSEVYQSYFSTQPTQTSSMPFGRILEHSKAGRLRASISLVTKLTLVAGPPISIVIVKFEGGRTCKKWTYNVPDVSGSEDDGGSPVIELILSGQKSSRYGSFTVAVWRVVVDGKAWPANSPHDLWQSAQFNVLTETFVSDEWFVRSSSLRGMDWEQQAGEHNKSSFEYANVRNDMLLLSGWRFGARTRRSQTTLQNIPQGQPTQEHLDEDDEDRTIIVRAEPMSDDSHRPITIFQEDDILIVATREGISVLEPSSEWSPRTMGSGQHFFEFDVPSAIAHWRDAETKIQKSLKPRCGHQLRN